MRLVLWDVELWSHIRAGPPNHKSISGINDQTKAAVAD